MPDDIFGPGYSRKTNPFSDDPHGSEPTDDAARIEHAARIRRLRSQVGAEGLTLSATRELLDHVSTALDTVARALRDR